MKNCSKQNFGKYTFSFVLSLAIKTCAVILECLITFCALQCEPIAGLGFRRGSYKCVCKTGYYYPNSTSENRFFNGTDLEEEYSKILEVSKMLFCLVARTTARVLQIQFYGKMHYKSFLLESFNALCGM